ncbi:MAG: lipase [Gemmatimonadetes bacterium]|nr:MAG: lipase [Gemmatimonadota bacterium]
MKARFYWMLIGVILTSLALANCGSDGILDVPAGNEPAITDLPPVKTDSPQTAIAEGLTPHFQNWLSANGYGEFDFARTDLDGGSFGGKLTASDPVTNQPVIFIHGNSDKALGDVFGQTGWTESVDYFQSQGYTSAELYGTTWGPANAALSAYQYHSREYLTFVRAFILAVKEYTGADHVDVITHSMGVTLARKAIKGGSGYDLLDGGYYNLGSPLTFVDTFVGIAGANLGLVSCYLSGGSTPTCANTNGLYPGYLWWGMGPYGVSDILEDINATSGYEGDYVYTIWSTVDEVIGYGGVVYGDYTSQIPGQDGEKVFYSAPYGHFNVKDLTGYYQWRMVKYHSTY